MSSMGDREYQVKGMTAHPELRKGKCLNLGCGFTKFLGENWTNVDKYANCEPDVVHDLEVIPYPWPDNEFDFILSNHVLEHLNDWWSAFTEIARILKPGGYFELHCPDESSSTALTFRDHLHVFYIMSFHGIGRRDDPQNIYTSGTNAWAKTVEGSVPLELIYYHRVPFKQYNWMGHWPFMKLLQFCSMHMRNFIWEQQFVFRKFDRGKK